MRKLRLIKGVVNVKRVGITDVACLQFLRGISWFINWLCKEIRLPCNKISSALPQWSWSARSCPLFTAKAREILLTCERLMSVLHGTRQVPVALASMHSAHG